MHALLEIQALRHGLMDDCRASDSVCEVTVITQCAFDRCGAVQHFESGFGVGQHVTDVALSFGIRVKHAHVGTAMQVATNPTRPDDAPSYDGDGADAGLARLAVFRCTHRRTQRLVSFSLARTSSDTACGTCS